MKICCVVMCLLSLPAASTAADTARRVSSVVRADARTGRLVRSTTVSPANLGGRSVEPRVITPREVDLTAAVPSRQPAAISEVVEEAARLHQIDPLLVHSVIQVESNYNPLAISPKGAEGLMQLIPATARRFGALNSFDVKENITAGVKYLKYLQDMFRDDRLALAAYNAGEGAVQKYKDIPPYRETEQYVYKVGKRYGDARKRQQQAVEAAAPEPSAPAAEARAEPLRQLEVATDAEGRVILKTR